METRKVGRPTEYSQEIIEKTLEYLSNCGVFTEPDTGKIILVNLPSIEGLAYEIKVSKNTLYEWEKKHTEFQDVMDELRAKQAQFLINNGLSGAFNPTITKVILTKHGYREGIDQTTNDKELPTPILHGVFSNNSTEENSETV